MKGLICKNLIKIQSHAFENFVSLKILIAPKINVLVPY